MSIQEPGAERLIGVLGGMGPLATAEFMRKILAHTPSLSDQEHLPVIIVSIPQIPDRTAAFIGRGASPLAAMTGAGLKLVDAGARLIVMPCNTAHIWYADLLRALRTPMLHIVDAVLADVLREAPGKARIGLLATSATLESGIYAARAASSEVTRQLDWVIPTGVEVNKWISPAIAAVKAGRPEEGHHGFARACLALTQRGADCIVLGCTEISLALDRADVSVPLVDSTDALARATVDWYLSGMDPGAGTHPGTSLRPIAQPAACSGDHQCRCE